MAEAQHPQFLVVYEQAGSVIVYTTAYVDEDCREALKDCEAKYGKAMLAAAPQDKKGGK